MLQTKDDLTPWTETSRKGHGFDGKIFRVMWMRKLVRTLLLCAEWFDLRKISNRLVQSAGDRVPPGTELKKIKLVMNLLKNMKINPKEVDHENDVTLANIKE